MVDSDTLKDLREFLSLNFKFILLECKFFDERVKPLISVPKILEPNLGNTSLMQSLIDCVKFCLDSELRFCDVSVSEFKNTISKTFTTGEKKAIQGTCNGVISESQCEVWKVLDEKCGLHPTPTFFYNVQF